jgi:cell division protein FtsW
MISSWKKIFPDLDYTFFILPLVLTIFSLSTLFYYGGDNSLFYKQFFISILGIVLFLLVLKIDFSILKNGHFTFVFYIISIAVLSLLLFLGNVTNNAQSWFKIFGVSVQPVSFS